MNLNTTYISLGAVAFVLSACGRDAAPQAVTGRIPATVYSCGSGDAPTPPSKLIIPPSGGISGRYLVVLMDSATDVSAEATALTAKYSGTLLYTYSAPKGFAALISDAKAPLLAAEASVCWVEQDAVVHVTFARANAN